MADSAAVKRFWKAVAVEEAVLRDGPLRLADKASRSGHASTSSVPPQDERAFQRTAHPEERLRSRAAASRRRVSKDGFRVTLDGRPIRTQGGAAQIVPTQALAEALAEEWRAQGEKVDPHGFPLRDLADYAIDQVRPDRNAAVARLLAYAETDTLCYRADPDEPLHRRQRELWEPVLTAFEARHAVRLERVSGVIHRPQPPETLARLREGLAAADDWTLAALTTLAPLAASLTVALEAIEPGADPVALFAAANCEQDWQAELWGWEAEAERVRAMRLAAFEVGVRFARLVRG